LATETTVTEDDIPKLTMLYKVESGPVREQSYGIKLAGAVGFPGQFLELAQEVSDKLRHQAEAKKRGSSARKIALKRKLILGLRDALQVAYNSGMDDGALAAYLRKLQAEFIQRMEENESPVEDEVPSADEGAAQDESDDADTGVIEIESDSDSE
jgi:DNA mismatch repair protein MSH4